MTALRTLLVWVVVGGWLATSALAGAPLKGVDVKLGRAPGGTTSARIAGDGAFSFGVVPAGTYQLELVGVAGIAPSATGALLTVQVGRLSISKTVPLAVATGRKSGSVIYQLEVTSDGKSPITGTLTAQ